MFPAAANAFLTASYNTEQDKHGELSTEISTQLDGQLADHDAIFSNLDFGIQRGVERRIRGKSGHVA